MSLAAEDPYKDGKRRPSRLQPDQERRGSVRRPSARPDDDALLERLGHIPELDRNFSRISMLGLAFAILNSWTALAASLSLALPSGGSTSVLWGLVTAGVCNLALAASMAELLSAYPTSGGQYHWVAMMAWKRWVPLLSWITGWINVAGWIALVATAGLLGSQLVIGVIALYNPTYVAQRWQQFLIYIGYTVVAFVINAFANESLPYVNKTAFIWSISGFVVISIVVLGTSSPNFASAKFVFTDFYNATGWPDGVAWLLGLLQGGLGLIGYDAVAHMIEEIPNPTVEGPKVMLACVGIGVFTGFIFLMILLFVSGGQPRLSGIISTTRGPLLDILYIATSNKAGAVCLLIFPLVCLLFAGTSIMTTSSRMTYAFARDGGLPASRFFAKVHQRLGLPLNALCLTAALVIIFGCIFLGSTAAFNAIISASVVALNVSYGMPVAVSVLQGRRKLPPGRAFRLSPALGWASNVLGVVYVLITTVLFLFPPFRPVTGTNMNYCIVAFAIVLVVATIQWFVDGRKNFEGPQGMEEELASNNVLVAPPTKEGGEGPGEGNDVDSSGSDGREVRSDKKLT